MMGPAKFRIVVGGMVITMLCLAAFNGDAQVAWQLKKDEEGIKVYTGNTPNSCFKSIKVECVVHATLSQLAAALLDVARQSEWVYCNKTTHVIRRIASNELLYYAELEVPWPCTDRDYVSHIVMTQPLPSSLVIDANTEPKSEPEVSGVVRVQKSHAHWEVTSISKDQQKIQYTVMFDPAGALPAWLVNMFVTKGPLITFHNLKNFVSKPEYRNAHLDFIKESL